MDKLINNLPADLRRYLYNVYLEMERNDLLVVQREPCDIENIINPSEAVKLAAVKQMGWAIKYISLPSEAIQLAAVQDIGVAIQCIHWPSEAVQIAAVKKSNGDAIRYIHLPSKSLVKLAAVEQQKLLRPIIPFFCFYPGQPWK